MKVEEEEGEVKDEEDEEENLQDYLNDDGFHHQVDW